MRPLSSLIPFALCFGLGTATLAPMRALAKPNSFTWIVACGESQPTLQILADSPDTGHVNPFHVWIQSSDFDTNLRLLGPLEEQVPKYASYLGLDAYFPPFHNNGSGHLESLKTSLAQRLMFESQVDFPVSRGEDFQGSLTRVKSVTTPAGQKEIRVVRNGETIQLYFHNNLLNTDEVEATFTSCRNRQD